MVTLELDSGYREVEIPDALREALDRHGMSKRFHDLTYSKRKEFARQVADAKAEDTKARRIEKIMQLLQD